MSLDDLYSEKVVMFIEADIHYYKTELKYAKKSKLSKKETLNFIKIKHRISLLSEMANFYKEQIKIKKRNG